MKFTIVAIVCIIMLLTSCSHNPAVFAMGEHNQIGFGPPETSAGWTSTKGLLIADMPRENSSFSLEIDSEEGVSIDPATGNIKGVKKITRSTGLQITGYLVKLAKANPELAKIYIEAMLANQKTEQQLPQGAKASGE